MRSTKKCLTFLLAILTVLSCFAFGGYSTFAATITEDGVTYSIKAETASVVSYENSDDVKEVVIPQTIQGCTVVSIGTQAFWKANVVSVTLPDTVKTIGEFAFDECKELESIAVGDNIETIGMAAFRDCSKLKSFDFGNIVTIATSAFKESGLTSAEIPDTCTSIGVAAFANCESLESVKLPEGLEIISGDLFYKCKALKSIDIPESVTIIKVDAFNYCSGLERVNMGNNVEVIEQRAFHSCSSLKDLYLSKSLKSIGTNAFWGCMSLADVVLPDSIKTIEFQVFRECESLKELMIPYGVETIASRVFSKCTNLQTVYIPGTVSSLDELAFHKCDNLTTIYGEKNSRAHEFAKEKGINFIGYELDDDGFATITCYDCPGVVDVTIPADIAGAKVIAIGNEAFRGNTEIKSVAISNDITYIGDMAFEGCTNLESINFSTDSTHIGKYAFANCESIKTLCLPVNVATIDEGAFGYVSSEDEFVPWDDFALYSGNNSAPQEYAKSNSVNFRFGVLKELATGRIVMGVNYTENSYKDGDEYRLVNILGDVNDDMVVNVKDATLIQKYCASLASIEEAQMYLADTTLDGAVNVRDATQIQKYVASIIDSFYK